MNRSNLHLTALRPPICDVQIAGSRASVFVSGDWVLKQLNVLYQAIEAIDRARTAKAQSVEIDISRVGALDTAGALALLRLQQSFVKSSATFENPSREHRILLDEVGRASQMQQAPQVRSHPILSAIEMLARATTAIGRDGFRLTNFLGQVASAFGRVVANPKRFRGTAFIHQVQQTGLTAVPIIALVCFLIGGVVMQQGAQQLKNFGAETLAIDLLGILALREVGVILAAVMVAGRSASAFTAQIGTMKMREEIDAMRTIGIDPIETLILPRILALIVSLPLLVFIADIAALAGGAVTASLYLDLDLQIYMQRLNSALSEKHFWVGLIKAPFVALIIGLVGCLEGLSVEGSAESVGTQVTTAVVKAIFLVLVLDGVFAIFLSAAGF